MNLSGLSPKDLLAPENRKPAVVLLLAPVLLTTFKYYGSKAFYLSHLAGTCPMFGDGGRTAELYHFLCAFVLLGLVPALVTRLAFRESLRTYGVQLGDPFHFPGFLGEEPAKDAFGFFRITIRIDGQQGSLAGHEVHVQVHAYGDAANAAQAGEQLGQLGGQVAVDRILQETHDQFP